MSDKIDVLKPDRAGFSDLQADIAASSRAAATPWRSSTSAAIARILQMIRMLGG